MIKVELEFRDYEYYLKLVDNERGDVLGELGPYPPGSEVDKQKLLGEVVKVMVDHSYPLDQLIKLKEKVNSIIEKIREPITVYPSNFRAELLGLNVVICGHVVGEKLGLAIPTRLKLRCVRCGAEVTVTPRPIDVITGNLKPYKAALFSHPCKQRRHQIEIEPLEYTNLSMLFLHDPLYLKDTNFRSRLGTERILYVVGDVPPPVKTIKAYGSLELNGKLIVGISDKIEPLEEQYINFKPSLEDEKNFIKYFKGKSPEDLAPQIAPGMHGRVDYQISLLLLVHSPLYIPSLYNKDKRRGALRVLAFGDTKCYKSRAAIDLTHNLGLGEYVIAETSSRTGIVYTIDPDTRTLIWGVLPRNDGGLVVLDGLHSIFGEELQQLREVLEQMYVKVTRTVRGEAWARVRLLGILNLSKDKVMDDYVYRCQALKDTKVFREAPDLSRWDIYIPFSKSDVPPEQFVGVKPRDRPIPIDIFRRHVFWAWSLNPSDIVYTENARKLIKEKAIEFIDRYSLSELPIVHNGYLEVITRVSVSYAVLLHNVSNGKVVVDEGIVEQATAFLHKLLSMNLDLDVYKEYVQEGVVLSDDEAVEILQSISVNKRALKILESLIDGPKSSPQLAAKLGVSERTIADDFKLLRKHGLILTKSGVGAMLTTKGSRFLKVYREISSKLGLGDES